MPPRPACERLRVSLIGVSSSTIQGGGKRRVSPDADIRRRGPEAGGMRQCLRARMSSGEAYWEGEGSAVCAQWTVLVCVTSVIAVVKGNDWPIPRATTV